MLLASSVCLCCVMQCLHRELSSGFVFPYGTIQHYLKILAWDPEVLEVAELYCSDSSLICLSRSADIWGRWLWCVCAHFCGINSGISMLSCCEPFGSNLRKKIVKEQCVFSKNKRVRILLYTYAIKSLTLP